jgi:hypothetical protein
MLRLISAVVVLAAACGGVAAPPVAYNDQCVQDASARLGLCSHPNNNITGPYWEADPDHYGLVCPGGSRPDPARGHVFQFETDYFCVMPNFQACPGELCSSAQ